MATWLNPKGIKVTDAQFRMIDHQSNRVSRRVELHYQPAKYAVILAVILLRILSPRFAPSILEQREEETEEGRDKKENKNRTFCERTEPIAPTQDEGTAQV